MLVKGGVLAILVRGGNELVTLVLDPLPYAELVLGGTEHLRLLSGVLVAIVENEKNLALLPRGRGQRSDSTGLTGGVERRKGRGTQRRCGRANETRSRA